MDPQQTTQPQQSTIPPQHSPTPAPLPTFNKSKFVWLFLIGILSMGLIVGSYYVIPGKYKSQSTPLLTPSTTQPSPLLTPDLTINWQGYKNNKYNYSIKFPSDFETFNEKNNEDVYFIKNNTLSGPERSIHIFVADNPKNLGFNGWIKSEYAQNFLVSTDVNIKENNINNLNWYSSKDNKNRY